MAKNAPKPSKAPTPRRAYHHGELADVLMELAVEAIEQQGTEALSLRALAREAGVSATAPYRHFPSKRCLLAGVATKGFRQLTAAMGEELGKHTDVEARFIAMGTTYVRFAVDNPVPYKLMFGSVIADFSDYAMLKDAAEASYAQLLDQLKELIEEQQLTITPIELGAVVWSGVHGMASLMINQMGTPTAEQTSQPHWQHRSASQPGQSIATLHMNTERAMRVLFGNLIGDNGGIRA